MKIFRDLPIKDRLLNCEWNTQ